MIVGYSDTSATPVGCQSNRSRLLNVDYEPYHQISRMSISSKCYFLFLFNFQSLPIEGNPLRAIRRDIIQRGTIGLLKHLKSRLTNDEIAAIYDMSSNRGRGAESQDRSKTEGRPSTAMPDKYAMQKILTMDLSKRELEIIPGEVVSDAVEASVQRINLSNNRFRCG